ncbi:MAG: N-6 DNA methylase [Thiobacillaceae bacterium]
MSPQPLFNQRFLKQRISPQPTPPEHKKILHHWAEVITSGALRTQKETEVRGPFIQRFFTEILGYRAIGSGGQNWTINDEKRTGTGSADTALGYFEVGKKRVIAPVELKGADTADLDAIMPGRHKSPVMQAGEYAMDTAGCEFLLVSNMVEIRLYAVGHTRQVYECFNVVELADSDAAYWRFRHLLGADRFLNGETTKLLKESGLAEKEITNKLYKDYKAWRIKLLVSIMHSAGKTPDALIEPVQKLLDRVLFVAFAEDRGLLPPKTLSQAATYRDPYNPRPIWENYLGLFRSIDKGNPRLAIPAYNGGLFALDPALDSLPISDDCCAMFQALGEYDFADDVSVTVLGHIFEQSVSDLEKLKELAGQDGFSLAALETQVAESAGSVRGKRKVDGVVYTPDPVTRFIVDQTLGSYLADQQAALRKEYSKEQDGVDVWRKPTKEETTNYTSKKKQVKLKDTERLVEFLFWTEWRNRLCNIRVVDPACGSGAFLVAAFDVLDAEYRRTNEQIQAITGNPDLFDINREILNANLYGVDLNPESIEITKLSLWLKTAQHGKPLESLEANLRVGNSLIADAAFAKRPFDWQSEFPQVFAEGGFDVVLGNPPYVRMEHLKPVKSYLKKHFKVASGRADLYCYFYELGVLLLKSGGRLGYISSSTFFKSGSGQPLRRYLLDNTQIRSIVDFGDIEVFDGVTTDAAVVVLDRISKPDSLGNITFLTLGATMPESLAATFKQDAGAMAQEQLSDGSWQIEEDAPAAIRRKLSEGRPTLKGVYGAPLYGVKTGLNDAFVIDCATREQLVANDPNSAILIKRFLKGADDLAKWRIESHDQWLIYIPKGKINIDEFPAIKAHLWPFKAKLEERATKQEWFELQQPQEAYIDDFNGPKLVYPEMSQGAKFAIDETGYFLLNKLFYVPTTDWFLLGLLNSRLIWAYLFGISSPLRGGEWRLELRTQYMETVPIPETDEAVREQVGTLAKNAQRAAEERRDLMRSFARRVLTDLTPGGGSATLSSKLLKWPSMDFKAFNTEVKKQFKEAIPFAERDAWQERFEKDRSRVEELSVEIIRCQRLLDAAVANLFGVTAEEIGLMER